MAAIPSRSIRDQLASTFAVRLGGVLLGLASTSLAARILEPAKFGEYSFILAAITIASIPVTYGLRQTVTRQTAYALAREEPAHIRAVSVWAQSIALLAVLVALAGVAAWTAAAHTTPMLREELFLGVLILGLMTAPQVACGALHGIGRIVASQLPEFVVRPAVMVCLMLPLSLSKGSGPFQVLDILAIFAIAVLAESAVSVAMILRAPQFARPQAPAEIDRRALLITTLSFSAIAGVQVLNNNLDIIMLRAMASNTGIGLYRVAAALSSLAAFGLLIVNAVILPRIAALHGGGEYYALQTLVRRGSQVITLIALAGGAVLLIAGRELLQVFFGAKYAAAYPALAILTLGQFANAFFGPVALILNMTGNERLTLLGVVIAVIINLGLNLALIPRFGIIGAASATATSLFLWNFLLAVVLHRRTGITSAAIRLGRP